MPSRYIRVASKTPFPFNKEGPLAKAGRQTTVAATLQLSAA
jgi:hypothetical protein